MAGLHHSIFGLMVTFWVCLAAAGAAGAQESNVARPSVDLYVMSQCPDASFTEAFLAPVLQELQQFITLQLHFIGQKQADGSWSSKHGSEECAGDTQQLCVQQLTKPYNRVKWLLAFVLCSNKHGVGSFATAAKCLQEAHIPLSAATKMLGCIAGPTHTAVLEADFVHTQALGIKTSCTMQVDGSTVAVRDGGKWVTAPGQARVGDFREALCAAYAAKNRGRLPPPCKQERTSRGHVAASRR